MIAFIVLVCICVVLVAVLAGTVLRDNKEVGRVPPGPCGLPYFGQAFRMSVNSAYLKFTQWSREFGTVFMFTMFGRKVVVISDPDIILKTFADSELAAKTSDRPPSFIGNYIADSYKDILFRVYDDLCHNLKTATIRAMYSVDKDNVDYERLNVAEVNDFIRTVSMKDGDIDMIAPLEKSLCKMIGIMFSGELLQDDDPAFRAIEEFDIAGNEMIIPANHLVFKVVPFLRHLPGYYGNLYRRTIKSRENLKIHLLQNLKAERRSGDRSSLLSCMFQLQETEPWLTDDLILGVLMDLINTSTLTSRGVLSGIFFLLTHFPHVQERIQQEIDHVVGTDRQPASDDLLNMPYTHAVILETLRYQSHLAISATHTNSCEDIYIEGYYVPRGTSIYGNHWRVHHDEKYWSDPWSFKPERFLQDNGELIPADSKHRTRYFMPFGVGNRMCMGIKTTFDRMFLFTTCLLQSHKILPPSSGLLPSHDPRELTPGTVLQAPEFKCKIVVR